MVKVTGQDTCSGNTNFFRRIVQYLGCGERGLGKRSHASLGAEVGGAPCEARYRDGVLELFLAKCVAPRARPTLVI